MRKINQKALRDNYKCFYQVLASHILSKKDSWRCILIHCFLSRESYKVFKSGVKTLQQGVVNENWLTLCDILLTLQIKTSGQYAQKLYQSSVFLTLCNKLRWSNYT